MTTRKWSNPASRENGKLGGEVMRQRRMKEYTNNPKICKGCLIILPYRKHHNTFCSNSCSGTYTGRMKDHSKIRTGPLPKEKEPKVPFSVLYRCVCKHCGLEWRAKNEKRICEDHEFLYSHNGRALFWFTFSLSSYPDLFDGEIIRLHGMRSKGNPNGVTRDHRVSVNEAIRNGYDPYYIKHPLNCELMLFDENNKKNTKSSITYENLVKQINEYDRMVDRVGIVPTSSKL